MIEEVILKNFKCFKDQLLKTRALTLLSGVNGMGKSTFIQSLLAVRQSYLQNLFPKIGLSLNGDLVKLGTAKDVLFEYANEEEIEIHVGYKNKSQVEFKFDYKQSSDVLPLKANNSTEEFFRENLFTDKFQYLSAERIGPRLAFDMSDFHVVQHRQIGTTGQYTAHFLATHGSQPVEIETLRFSAQTSNSLVANVEAWLGAISPGTRITVTPHAGMGLVNLEYSFARGQLIGKTHRPTNVGFGITFILPVLVALLSAEPGSLLLIENPEAHLHPKGQSMLATLMAIAANSGVQLIVESHSDHFLNGLRLAIKDKKIKSESVSVNFLEFDETSSGSKVTNLSIGEDGTVAHWPVDFFDEFEKSLVKLI